MQRRPCSHRVSFIIVYSILLLEKPSWKISDAAAGTRHDTQIKRMLCIVLPGLTAAMMCSPSSTHTHMRNVAVSFGLQFL